MWNSHKRNGRGGGLDLMDLIMPSVQVAGLCNRIQKDRELKLTDTTDQVTFVKPTYIKSLIS